MSDDSASSGFLRLRRRRRRGSVVPSLAPLLDVLFLLLIFLLVAANFDREQVVPVELPRVSSGEPPWQDSADRLIVVLQSNGTITLDGRVVSLEDLALDLDRRPAEERLRSVLIQGDQDASLGAGMGILDVLRRLGYSDAAFQVKADAR